MTFPNGRKAILLFGAVALMCTLVVAVLTSCRAEAAVPKPNPNTHVFPGISAVGPILLPLGVADTNGETGYLQNPEHGISAINLSTGQILWSSTDAAQPLIPLWGFRLAAMRTVSANSIRVVILDSAHEGKKLLESELIALPDWVDVNGGYGHSFHISAKARGGELLLFWEAHARYAGGAAPPPEIEKVMRKDASGAFRVKFGLGHVEILPDGKDPEEPAPSLAPSLSTVKSQQYWTGSSWETRPFIIGVELKALVQDTVGDQQTLRLKRWDLVTGKLLIVSTLMTGRALWPEVTLDGGSLLVRQALPKESLPPGDDGWSIFSLRTGSLLAKLPLDALSGEVSVVNGRLFTLIAGKGQRSSRFGSGERVIPRSLRAIDLKSGGVLWEQPVVGQTMLPMPV